MKKRFWIAVAAAALVLLGAILFFTLRTPNETVESGDADCLYPYYYEKTKKGTVVHITGEAPESYTWEAYSDASALHVEKLSEKTDHTRFLLSETGSGSARVVFSLGKEESGAYDRVYEILTEIYVDPQEGITVDANHHRELGGMQTASGESISCRVTSEADGSILVFAESTGEVTWRIEKDGSAVTVREEPSAQGVCWRLSYRELGQCLVRACSSADEAAEIFVSTDLLGGVKLVSTEVVEWSFEQKDVPPSEGGDEELFELFYGKIALPQQAFEYQRSVGERTAGTGEDGEEIPAAFGRIGFSMDGHFWDLTVSTQLTAEDYAADYAGRKLKRAPLSEESSAELFTWKDGAAAVWTDAQGRCFHLTYEGADAESVRAAAQKVIGANANG